MNLTPNMPPTITLYGFWRSLATYRVRAALNLKGLAYTEHMVDLLKGEQFAAGFHDKNPQHVLPVLEVGSLRLTQSLPIIEFLDETFPGVKLLPADAGNRARVRALAQITTADTHPLVVPRVRKELGANYGLDEAQQMRFARHWFDLGSKAIEEQLAPGNGSGDFAHGDTPTLADLALVSHVIGVRLFGADPTVAPRLMALADRCLAIDAFARAHPSRQVGAPA